MRCGRVRSLVEVQKSYYTCYRYLTRMGAGEDENKGVRPLVEVQQPHDSWHTVGLPKEGKDKAAFQIIKSGSG